MGLQTGPQPGAAENCAITPAEYKDLLGNPPSNRDIYQGNDYAGVVTGLAWTSVGGETLTSKNLAQQGQGWQAHPDRKSGT